MSPYAIARCGLSWSAGWGDLVWQLYCASYVLGSAHRALPGVSLASGLLSPPLPSFSGWFPPFPPFWICFFFSHGLVSIVYSVAMVHATARCLSPSPVASLFCFFGGISLVGREMLSLALYLQQPALRSESMRWSAPGCGECLVSVTVLFLC